MEIRQFEYFAAIVREGSFGRAARTLHVSQPALSKQIHALERELGAELLIRGAGGVRATEAGRRLSGMCEEILEYLAGIPEAIRAAPAELSGTVAIGVAPSLVPVLADRIRTTFATKHPAVQLQIIEAPPLLLMESLDLGRLDVGLFSRWPPHDESPRLDFTDLAAEAVVLVGSSGLMPDDFRGPATGDDLRRLPLALSPGYRNLVRRLYPDVVPDELGLEIDSLQMIRAMVLRGERCSVLPASFVREDIASGAMRAVGFAPPLNRQVAAVTRTGRRPSAAASAVIDIARARLDELAGVSDQGRAAVPSPT